LWRCGSTVDSNMVNAAAAHRRMKRLIPLFVCLFACLFVDGRRLRRRRRRQRVAEGADDPVDRDGLFRVAADESAARNGLGARRTATTSLSRSHRYRITLISITLSNSSERVSTEGLVCKTKLRWTPLDGVRSSFVRVLGKGLVIYTWLPLAPLDGAAIDEIRPRGTIAEKEHQKQSVSFVKHTHAQVCVKTVTPGHIRDKLNCQLRSSKNRPTIHFVELLFFFLHFVGAVTYVTCPLPTLCSHKRRKIEFLKCFLFIFSNRFDRQTCRRTTRRWGRRRRRRRRRRRFRGGRRVPTSST